MHPNLGGLWTQTENNEEETKTEDPAADLIEFLWISEFSVAYQGQGGGRCGPPRVQLQKALEEGPLKAASCCVQPNVFPFIFKKYFSRTEANLLTDHTTEPAC